MSGDKLMSMTLREFIQKEIDIDVSGKEAA